MHGAVTYTSSRTFFSYVMTEKEGDITLLFAGWSACGSVSLSGWGDRTALWDWALQEWGIHESLVPDLHVTCLGHWNTTDTLRDYLLSWLSTIPCSLRIKITRIHT